MKIKLLQLLIATLAFIFIALILILLVSNIEAQDNHYLLLGRRLYDFHYSDTLPFTLGDSMTNEQGMNWTGVSENAKWVGTLIDSDLGLAYLYEDSGKCFPLWMRPDYR